MYYEWAIDVISLYHTQTSPRLLNEFENGLNLINLYVHIFSILEISNDNLSKFIHFLDNGSNQILF